MTTGDGRIVRYGILSGVRCDVLVLGPVLVAGAVRPSSPLTRTIVGLLGVAGGDGLSDGAIGDLVWGVDPVPVSRLNVAVHRARDWLDRHTGGRVRIDRTTTGYTLRGGLIDATRFTELLAGEPNEQDLLTALTLWRGAPLADVVALGGVEPLVAPLHEWHRAAVLGYARVLVGSARAAQAVGVLTPVADTRPMDEQVHALLLTALAADGRQADALARYDQVRRRLADELGVDPGTELSDAMVGVLRGAGPTREVRAPVVRPAQLTPDVTAFIGRRQRLAELDAAADSGTRVALVTGVGGVGKTALAVHWAHGRAADFPDGHLYVDLRGYSHGRPVTPAEALARFLRGLGVAPAALPADTDESATLYRSLLAGRRMLVVLDNAADAAQVRPLLPGDPGSAVVVTGRDRLDGLVVRDGATRVALDLLGPAESLALLTVAVGDDRVRAEPEAAAELAGLCGHLPLALRVVAANLIARPNLRIADCVATLAADRMAGLTVSGDPASSVHEVFDRSYRRLDADVRRMYRLLGVAPGADITAAGAAALADGTEAAARRALGALVIAHLVVEDDDRYSMHDLISEHARGRADDDERDAAVERLEDWYGRTAEACCHRLWPNMRLLPNAPDIDAPLPDDPAAWLAAETANLIAVVRHAADHGRHDYVWRTVHGTRAVLDFGDSAAALLASARLGLASAVEVRDWVGISALSRLVASTCQRTGQLAEAPQHTRMAIEAADRVGWVSAKVAALNDLAIWHGSTGELARANEILREVVANCTTPELWYLRAQALGNMATAYRFIGDLPAAARHARLSLAAYRRLDSAGEGFVPSLLELAVVQYEMGRLTEARRNMLLVRWAPPELSRLDTRCGSADWLARVECASGNLTDAVAYADEGAELAVQTQDQERLTNAQATRGLIELRLGRPATALDHFRAAAGIAVAATDPAAEAAALIGMAAAHQALGEWELALAHAEGALRIARDRDYRLVRSDAHTMLATADLRHGRTAAAASHARQALAMAGASEHRAERARKVLTETDAATD
ncbi:MAG TPA: BTAD domain-containing putative transcriptional regulator [Pseudonocardiaceae bacterium]|nr:BTAD domain-containing putative transcriptional regulator [Pseudonocardiaceae bacterium]